MYIRHQPLFSFETLQEYQPKTRLGLLFETLDLHPCLKELPAKSIRGPKGYCGYAMLRALVAKQLFQIPTFTLLVERLAQDLSFAYDCGFRIGDSRPSVATFSRFYQRLSQIGALEKLFESLVTEAMEQCIVQADVVAIDASQINAYEKARPKKQLADDGGSANWGAKRDTHGNQIAWFGYKLHLAIDARSELPLSLTVTPAHRHDSTQAIPLMEQLPVKPQAYCLDMGYDVKSIYEYAHSQGAKAIVPLNRRGEIEPPAGFDANRTPVCSMGYPMVYWGADAKRGELKFRCPHVCGKVECPQRSCWCSTSDYGMVVKCKIADDLRGHSLPHRGSRNWKELYNLRTSVERVFSRLKEMLGADSLKVRGLQKVRAHLTLCWC
ncbi:MAG: transposase [Anaeromusa sp.]|uniref:transposase n=1 Tax=Anaeromusa sp. TaxID=1872520 RepID=UPI002B2158A6|nr:transposase [Anaeromusa sp.]MEA4834374.1 transposase [Anaeromusa sp.]